MLEPNKYFVDFVDDHDGVEEVSRVSGINRQTLRQAYLGRNGISAAVIKKMTESYKDFDRDAVLGKSFLSNNLVSHATDEPGENQVSLLKARIKYLEETVEEKKKTIKERESMIRFLATTHPDFKEQLEALNFNQGVTRERYKNRGPIHRREECFVPSWQRDAPEPNA